ncbi:acyl-CoA dehydrogenase family protein [Nocardia miyunensis]|uniref:acyl-CoA dehydrogenase family protein n=1 Tax=Nocardia miyunensis TaxID=282684 RepID=UPI00083499B5|nr:acyl-CoA dehydrogenase family protein [Nocardia miyunensis]
MSAESPLRELISDLAESAGPGGGAGELPQIWPEMVKLGLNVVGIAESSGGADGTLADLAVLSEALGQHGIGVPLIEASTSNWVLAEAGQHIDPASLSVIAVTAEAWDGEGPVTARLGGVAWARGADRVIVYPEAGSPVSFMIGDPGVSVEPGVNLAGEQSDTVVLTAARGAVLASAPERDVVLARLGVLWSAAVLGAVRGAYDLTREYVRTREQFGAPLVKIPSVAAGLATIRTQLLQADATVDRAVELSSSGAQDNSVLAAAAVARIVCATSATETARIAHQLHGAMGITAEYPLHRLTTKLWAWRDAVQSEARWSELVGDATLAQGENALWCELTATN